MARVPRVHVFTALPALGVSGVRVLDLNDNRVGGVLTSRGGGAVYISHDGGAGADKFQMNFNDSLNFLPYGAPTDPLFAWGDAGHRLEVLEVYGPATSSERGR